MISKRRNFEKEVENWVNRLKMNIEDNIRFIDNRDCFTDEIDIITKENENRLYKAILRLSKKDKYYWWLYTYAYKTDEYSTKKKVPITLKDICDYLCVESKVYQRKIREIKEKLQKCYTLN